MELPRRAVICANWGALRRAASTALSVCFFGASLVACGGQAPPAAEAPVDASTSAEAADGEPEPDPLSSGTQAFDEAERELEALFLSKDTDNDGVPATEPIPGPARPKTQEQDDGDTTTALQARDRCDVACKALASMKRSADGVCDMTGEGDTRCERLRDRVERARSTVYDRCPACSAARR